MTFIVQNQGQTSDIGKSFCFTCALGKAFTSNLAEDACSVCAAGKRSVDLVCRSCEVGFYQNKEETGFCLRKYNIYNYSKNKIYSLTSLSLNFFLSLSTFLLSFFFKSMHSWQIPTIG
tara:strand:- start:490 stop:843 length:354 start_codon:yes stop_codon:yes gene_type:complete